MKQKKRQIITIWLANNKRFTTFKAFKRWLWYNLHTGETLEGFQIWEDTIFKRYNIKKSAVNPKLRGTNMLNDF